MLLLALYLRYSFPAIIKRKVAFYVDGFPFEAFSSKIFRLLSIIIGLLGLLEKTTFLFFRLLVGRGLVIISCGIM